MSQKSAIIIGAGHNGLVAGAYLAKAGLDVTIVEARETIGGAAVTEELIPGYKMSVASFVVGLLRPEIINDLELESHGLELYASKSAISCTIFDDNSNFFMWKDLDKTLKDIKDKFGEKDMQGFMQFGMDMQAVGEVMGPMIMNAPPTLSEFTKAFELADAMHLFERFITGSVRDLVEHYFDAKQLQAHFIFPGLVSMYGGPSTPGTAYLVAHHCVGEFQGQFGMWGYAKGGMGAISHSLASAALSHGAEILTGTAVEHIITKGNRAVGVKLANGKEIKADYVLSNADPKRTFEKLLKPSAISTALSKKISEYDTRGTMARVYVVVEELPKFVGIDKSLDDESLEGHIFLGASTDVFEDAWDEHRRGRIPKDFPIEVLIDTYRDDSFTQTDNHVLILGIQQLPFQLKDDNWDNAKHGLVDAAVAKLCEYAPNLKNKIVATECRTPLDWERDYNLTGGNIYHGAMGLTRLMGNRPIALKNGYETDIADLFLCGSGTHPGGGVMGASGFNSAMAVLHKAGVKAPRAWQAQNNFNHAPKKKRSITAAAFEVPIFRKIMTATATNPLTRPINRFLTRSKKV